MGFLDLSQSDRDLISQLDAGMVRPALRLSRKNIALMRQVVLQYDTVTKSAIDKLQENDVIPYDGGFAGAVGVSVADVRSMVEAFRTLVNAWDSTQIRELHTKFVGAINIDG